MSKLISVVIAIGLIIAFALFVSGCSGPKSPGMPSVFVQSKTPKNETELNNYYTIAPATAKEWRGVAEREVLNHSNDMILCYADGMQDDRDPLPVNGTARAWNYEFYSPSSGAQYIIMVKAGVVDEVEFLGTDNVSSNLSSPGIKDWNLDSDAAAIKANETYRQDMGMDPVGRARYQLIIGNTTYDHHPIWDIQYDPAYEKGYGPKHYFHVRVDASTGAVLSSTNNQSEYWSF